MFALAFAVIAYLIGLAGAGVFFAYVVGTGTGYLPRTEPTAGAGDWGKNVFLLTLFALQHSGMARLTFKQRLGVLGRSIYVATSGIVVTALVLFWEPLSGEPVWQGPIWIFAISVLGALGIIACCRWFDHGSFFGLTQAWTGESEIRGPLCIEGPYRYVRHPLMLGFLIAIWAQPIMPPELLMMNVELTVYVLIAIPLEERDLVRDFGEEYETYRTKVARLIPFVW
ncbi:MAG: isoprenylcysteine carboxylmethyltransferase family protein [Gemmataceae bacterium]|nr:isoprenylcysteine carboxylmethyltransferase family protein [Gemmataceae bacterium]